MEAEKLYRWLEKLGIEKLHESQGNIRGCCPYHKEREPSWGINTSEPHPFGCFACGAKGTLYHLLVQVGGYSPTKAKKICLIHETEMNLPTFRESEVKIKDDLVDRTLLYPFTLQKKARKYLEKRGISCDTAKKARVVYDPIEDRLIFPWYFEKRLTAVTARPFDQSGGVKSMPIWGSLKRNNLYIPSRTIASGRLVVVEGEIDALSVYELGQQVAAIGRGTLSRDQARILIESACDEVCIFTDNDSTGVLLAESLKKRIGFSKRLTMVNYASVEGKYKSNSKLDPAALTEAHRILVLKLAKSDVNWPTF